MGLASLMADRGGSAQLMASVGGAVGHYWSSFGVGLLLLLLAEVQLLGHALVHALAFLARVSPVATPGLASSPSSSTARSKLATICFPTAPSSRWPAVGCSASCPRAMSWRRRLL